MDIIPMTCKDFGNMAVNHINMQNSGIITTSESPMEVFKVKS